MIIVSQGKKEIINFNNITDIHIEFIHSDYELRASFVGEVGSFNIGNYETEERAKETLQEIADTFIGIRALENIEKDLTFDENTQVRIRPKVYYMPED